MTVSGAPDVNEPFPTELDHLQHHRDLEDAAGAVFTLPGSPPTFTQTYSTTATTVAAATSAAVVLTATVDAPAGGTGAAAGGWDTAGHRDAAIAVINALRADVGALKTDNDLLRADVLTLRKLINALIDIDQAAALAL